MNYIILIIAFLCICQYFIKAQVDFGCPKPWCAAYGNCPKFSCKGPDLKTIHNATKCGCCHKCIKELKEDDECQSEMTGNTPGTQCGSHLTCHLDIQQGKSFCRKLSQIQNDMECEKKRVILLSKMSELTTGEPIPECDEFGFYAGKICKNGTLCNCVDKSGNRIFGTSTYDKAKDMDCLCSRQYEEVKKQLSEFPTPQSTIDPVFYLRCKANGNYEPFQFVGNLTYCVNTTSGELKERPVQRRDVQQLTCNKHRYPYESECTKRYLSAMEEIEKLKEDHLENGHLENGHLVVGYDVPKCDIDGTFAPVQCLNAHCFCVNKKGERYKDTSIERSDGYFAKNQQCNCVRELELIRDISGKTKDKVTDLFSHYKCDKNGNYLPIQCSESVCYCVDEIFGYQKYESILKTEGKNIKKLKCLHDYPSLDKKRLFQIFENEFE